MGRVRRVNGTGRYGNGSHPSLILLDMAAATNDSVMNTENTAANATLTEEEASRYDRQMRLWGIEAQQRYVWHFSIQLLYLSDHRP